MNVIVVSNALIKLLTKKRDRGRQQMQKMAVVNRDKIEKNDYYNYKTEKKQLPSNCTGWIHEFPDSNKYKRIKSSKRKMNS